MKLLAGKGIPDRRMRLGAARTPAFVAALLLAFVTVALPLAAIVVSSLQRTPASPLTDLTTSHWREVLTNARVQSATGWSLLLSAAAGLIVAALGLAIALIRRRFPVLGRLGELLAAWPFAVPGTVFAMALIVAFSRDFRFVFADRLAFTLTLADTAWLVVVAYVAKHVALGSQSASDSLSQQDPSLAEAARVLGAGPRRAFLDAVLPLLRPALTTAFLLTFLTCATELTMSVLLIPAGRDLLGTLLFEYQSYSQPSAASVLACAFVLVVIAALALLAGVRKRAR